MLSFTKRATVTSIDFSEVVIQEMQSRHPEMEWELMDMTQMSYPGGSFDAVVDKGSLDALMSEDSDAVRLKAVRLKANAFFAEINRVLTSPALTKSSRDDSDPYPGSRAAASARAVPFLSSLGRSPWQCPSWHSDQAMVCSQTSSRRTGGGGSVQSA